MTARPGIVPLIDSNASARTAPAGSIQSDGYLDNAILPAREHNWAQGFASDWLTWLDERSSDGATAVRDLFLNGVDATSGGLAGGRATMQGGDSDAAGAGGVSELVGGDSPTGTGGTAQLVGGQSVSGGGDGATVAALGSPATGVGGALSLSGGNGTSGSVGGAATFSGGDGDSSGGASGGAITVAGGAGTDAGGASGGTATLSGGDSTSGNSGGVAEIVGGDGGTTGSGGVARVLGGAGGSTSGAGGSVLIQGATPTSGTGGNIDVVGGSGAGASGTGGDVAITGGAGTGTGIGGGVSLNAAAGLGTGAGGGVTIGSGDGGTNQSAGNININGGLGSIAGNGGSINLSAGTAGSTGNGGNVDIFGGPATVQGNEGEVVLGTDATPCLTVEPTTTSGRVSAIISNTLSTSIGGSGVPLRCRGAVSSLPALYVYHVDATATNNGIEFYSDVGGAETLNAIVKTDGDLENTNNSYTGISDIRLKENVRRVSDRGTSLAASTGFLPGVKAVEPIEYSLAEHEKRSANMVGFDAAEVQRHFPHLVRNSRLRPGMLSLNQVGMIPILWETIRTLINRIEKLETAPA